MYLTIVMGSCIARSGADVNIIGERRSQELTEALGQAMDLGRLWDQYGIVGDVTVSTLISHYQVIDNNKATFSLLECARTSLPPSLPILQAIHISLPSGRYL